MLGVFSRSAHDSCDIIFSSGHPPRRLLPRAMYFVELEGSSEDKAHIIVQVLEQVATYTVATAPNMALLHYNFFNRRQIS